MILVSENIVQYIRDNTTHDVVHGQFVPSSPDACMLVRETGGTSRRWPDDRQDPTIQFISRANDDPTAMEHAIEIFDIFRALEFNTTLPAPDKTGGVAVDIKKIDMLQRPYSLGLVDGYYHVSFNALLIYSDP